MGNTREAQRILAAVVETPPYIWRILQS